jgi:hypothetical protein
MLRSLICWVVIGFTPAWVTAADVGGMLYTNGVVLRNGAVIPDASAVFPGDLLETDSRSGANVMEPYTSVIILPGSLLEFHGTSLSLEHGSVSVGTSHGVSVTVGCITIVPVSAAFTHYEIIDVDGNIKIAARKDDVRLDVVAHGKTPKDVSAAQAGTLREGEETTRHESDGCKEVKTEKETGAVPTASGGILNSEFAKWVAIGGVGGLGAFLAVQHDDPAPASPFIP